MPHFSVKCANFRLVQIEPKYPPKLIDLKLLNGQTRKPNSQIIRKKLWTLHEMEPIGGEPNLLEYDKENDQFIFCDFVKESPKEEAFAMTNKLGKPEKSLSQRTMP